MTDGRKLRHTFPPDRETNTCTSSSQVQVPHDSLHRFNSQTWQSEFRQRIERVSSHHQRALQGHGAAGGTDGVQRVQFTAGAVQAQLRFSEVVQRVQVTPDGREEGRRKTRRRETQQSAGNDSTLSTKQDRVNSSL